MSERLRDYFYRFRKLLKRGGNWLMWVYVVVLIFGVSAIMGFLGVFLIHRGTSTSSKRVANMYILGGLALLAVGMAISGWLTYLKV